MTARIIPACPHCGAPLPGEADEKATCRFCGVTSVAVPTRAPVTAAVANGPPCPRCAAAMFEGKAGAATLLGCGLCGGIWLDNDSAKRVLATRDAGVAELAARADARANRAATWPAIAAACPSCRAPLAKTVDPRSQVELDLCALHGTFFDRYELGLVLRAWRQTPAQLARPTGPMTIPDFRQRDWDAGDGISGALVAGGAFAIVGALLGLADA